MSDVVGYELDRHEEREAKQKRDQHLRDALELSREVGESSTAHNQVPVLGRAVESLCLALLEQSKVDSLHDTK